jgi:hypothetical protein
MKKEMRYRYSGFSHRSPSERSQVIFSHVVIISPKEASTIVFPVSREDTLIKMTNELGYMHPTTPLPKKKPNTKKPRKKKEEGNHGEPPQVFKDFKGKRNK